MVNSIPILIPIKHVSQRCPNKNRVLLPYTIQFLEKIGRLENAVIITDSYDLIDLALSLQVNAHYEVRKPNQDELLSCWNYINDKNHSKFFLCPVTQPFRSYGLILEMENKYNANKDNIDFVCSITSVPNREIFHVVESNSMFSFKKQSGIRTGASCDTNLIIDGALYLIKTDFLTKVINSENTNRMFWNGRFTCALNSDGFI